MQLRQQLIDRAKAKHGEITPATNKNTGDGFVEQGGRLEFWYNDALGSSHVVFESIPCKSIPIEVYL